MKRVLFCKILFVAIIMLGFGGAIDVYGQSSDEHLPCLKKAYLATDGEVLLDCKPEESKYIAHNDFEWSVNKHAANKKAGAELKGCVKKKNGKYYLSPSEVYKKVKDEQVVVVYKQFSKDGSELTLYYLINVVNAE